MPMARPPEQLAAVARAAALRLAMVALIGFPAAQALPAVAKEGASAIRPALRCRLGSGPWTACRLTVDRLGERWRLDVNGEAISFEHDGRGTVRMRRAGGPWHTVQAYWNAEASLCWDGVCTSGDLPLD